MSASHDDRIAAVRKIYNEVKEIVASRASLGNRLDMMQIVVTVLTSSVLWALVSKALPGAALWLGAVLSTVALGIAVYVQTFGLNRVRAKL